MFNHILHWFTIYIRRWENFSDSNSAVKKPYTILNPLIPGMQRVTIMIHSRLCGNINTSNKWIEKFFKQNIHLKYLTNTGSYTLIYVIKGLSTDYSHHVSDPEVFSALAVSAWGFSVCDVGTSSPLSECELYLEADMKSSFVPLNIWTTK